MDFADMLKTLNQLINKYILRMKINQVSVASLNMGLKVRDREREMNNTDGFSVRNC